MRKLIVGDMFCGAGGTSHGLVNSEFVNIAWAINHDPNAILAHKQNHPNTLHHEEDIVSMDIRKLSTVDLLWASLECTHFSGAKGGQSRDADSRMLARQMYRYIKQTDPSFVVIENVREFLTWGPLIEVIKKGKKVMVADPKRKGIHYKDWVETICAMGYTYEYDMLNSADFGARTARNRFFGVFVKKQYQTSFPQPEYSKKGENGLPKWLPCRPLIDLENEGNSIFGREFNETLRKNVRRPLAENTIKRIVAGIKKFCLDGELLYDINFIMKYYGHGNDNNSNINMPLHTITTKDRHVLISLEKEHFVTEHFGTNRSVDEPMPTIMAYKDQKYLVTLEKAQMIQKNYSSKGENDHQSSSLDAPLHTILTVNKHQLVTTEKLRFIQKYFKEDTSNYNYLIDVKTRFLTADELKVIQGFDPGYQLIGSQATQKKAIGNSVVPLVAQKIIENLWLTNYKVFAGRIAS